MRTEVSLKLKWIFRAFWYFSYTILFFLIGCSGNRGAEREKQRELWFQDNGKIKVLSTTAIVNDLVKRVGGEFVDTSVLINDELDPHSYQLVKGDDEKLNFADLIFYNGLGLEHGPSLYRYLSNNAKAISLGDALTSNLESPVIVVEGQKDPHIWMDVLLFAKAIPAVVQALSLKDPQHTAQYEANGKKTEKEWVELDHQIKDILSHIPPSQRYLVTSHDAFNYFTRAYLALPEEVDSGRWHHRFAAPEGLAPESQLSPVAIREIINHLKMYQIHVIFPESNVSQDSIRKIANAAESEGFTVLIAHSPLYGDAMGRKGSDGDSYPKMMLTNARLLVEHLSAHK